MPARRARRRRRRPRGRRRPASATRRGATSPRCASPPTTGPSAAATGRARTSTAPAARTWSSWCRRGRRSRGSRASTSTWSSRASGRPSPPAGSAGTATSASPAPTQQAPRFAESGLQRASRLGRAAPAAARRRRAGRPAERRQVVAAGPADAGGAEGGRLSVHDPRAGARDDRRRRAPARPRRHPRADRGRRGRAPGSATSSSPTSSAAGCSSTCSRSAPAADPEAAYATVRGELAAHGAGLDRLPELIVLSKADLLPAEEVEPSSRRGASGIPGRADGDLVRDRRRASTSSSRRSSRRRRRPTTERRPRVPAGRARRFEAEHRVYRPARRGRLRGRRCSRTASSRSRAAGSRCWSSATTSANPEAVGYLERRLTRDRRDQGAPRCRASRPATRSGSASRRSSSRSDGTTRSGSSYAPPRAPAPFTSAAGARAALAGLRRARRTCSRWRTGSPSPSYVTSEPGDSGRLYVVERSGTIFLLTENGSREFADLTAAVGMNPRSGEDRDALDRVPTRFRVEPAALRLLHGHGRGHPDIGVEVVGERGRRDDAEERAHRSASRRAEPQRRPAPVRPRRLPLRRPPATAAERETGSTPRRT